MRVPLIVVLALGLSGCDGVSPPATSPPGRWDRHAENPLIVPELTTTTVDFGPADPTVMYDTDDNLWKVWFSSTRLDRVSVESTMTVRYSESADGVQWSTPQIALQPAADLAAWDHTHTKAPTVIKNPDPAAPPNQKFMLWYSGANTNMASTQNRPTTFPYYQIGLAYSADGKSFTRLATGLNNEPGLVLVANAFLFNGGLPGTYGDGLVADPEVVYRDNAFHMWFSSYAETVTTPVSPLGRTPLALGISHATSADGVTWTVDHPNPLASLAKPGDVIAGYYPSVLFNPRTGMYEMWFSNDTTAENASIPCGLNAVAGFWRAFSSDGVIWVPTYTARSLTYDQRFGFEALGFLPGIDVVLVDGQYHAFYSAWGTEQNPDPSWYRCADQTGGTRPAVVTLNHATYVPP